MRQITWNRKTISVVLLAVVLPVSLAVAFVFGYVGVFAGSNGSQLPLTIKLDKYVYYSGDWMNITITNVSNETIEFGSTSYDIGYSKLTDDGWEWYYYFYGGAMLTYLRPGEAGQVIGVIGGYEDKPFPPGRYRVGHRGYEVYAEFIVR
jgi:hypothetical protein